MIRLHAIQFLRSNAYGPEAKVLENIKERAASAGLEPEALLASLNEQDHVFLVYAEEPLMSSTSAEVACDEETNRHSAEGVVSAVIKIKLEPTGHLLRSPLALLASEHAAMSLVDRIASTQFYTERLPVGYGYHKPGDRTRIVVMTRVGLSRILETVAGCVLRQGG